LKDIQSWCRFPQVELREALDSLLLAQESGGILPLCVSPAAGRMLEEPVQVEATVGITELPTNLPAGWEATEPPTQVRTQGSWSGRIRTLVVAMRRILQIVHDAWDGELPEGAFRIVDLAYRDPAGMDLLLWVPPGLGPDVGRSLGALDLGEDCRLSVLRVRTAPPSAERPIDLRHIPGMAICLPSGVSAAILGPPPFQEDPISEALDLAASLQSRFQEIPRRSGRRE